MICKLPSCNKKLPPVAVTHGDPFCSSSCCKEFYNVPIWINEPRKQSAYVQSKPQEHQKMQVVSGRAARRKRGVKKYD